LPFQDCYEPNRESVHERLHEIDLNLVSDASDGSSSSSPTSYLMDNEHLNGKLAALKIRPDMQPMPPNPNKLSRLTQQPNSNSYQPGPTAFNEFNSKQKQANKNQEQLLDNSAIQQLVSEQTKAHLILDDAELLQCKSAQEFIVLFRNKLHVQNNMESGENSRDCTSQHTSGANSAPRDR
jgi:hypothetical protein